MKRLWLLPLLAACAAPLPPPAEPIVLEDTCGATEYRSLIGRDSTALEKVLVLGMVRVIRPGDAVTQDYQPERVNFMVGSDEKIQDINCG